MDSKSTVSRPNSDPLNAPYTSFAEERDIRRRNKSLPSTDQHPKRVGRLWQGRSPQQLPRRAQLPGQTLRRGPLPARANQINPHLICPNVPQSVRPASFNNPIIWSVRAKAFRTASTIVILQWIRPNKGRAFFVLIKVKGLWVTPDQQAAAAIARISREHS